AFRGDILQIPTMFSALKYQGQPLYRYARQGITVPREARPITIYRFELIDFTPQEASFIVHCSKGTYIRTLIDDLGEALGCGAHVSALHRTQVGPFDISQAQTVPFIEESTLPCHDSKDFSVVDALLLPMDAGIVELPSLTVTAAEQQQLQY